MAGIRALAAVMFTDAVSFSSHVGRDEEVALRQIEADFSLMRQLCAHHEGQVLKSMGDGMLLVFMSAQNATLCAIDIQRHLSQRTMQGSEATLLHRIGIHLCDIVLTESDAHGDGVNVAARLEREAPPGGIAMSQATYDLVRGKLPVKANFVGERYLRNIVEPVRIWEIPPVFATAGDHFEAAKLPRQDDRDHSVQSNTNWGTIGALLFVGLAVLIAACAVWFKGNGPSVPEGPKVTVEPGAIDPMKPPEVIQKIEPVKPDPKAVQPTTDSGGNDDLPDQLIATELRDAKASYDQAKSQFKAIYDFDGMLKWIEGQEWAATPAGRKASIHWTQLKDLRASVEAGLASHPPTQPLEVSVPESYKIWQIEGGRLGYMGPGNRQGTTTLAEIEPTWMKAIGVALNLGDRPGTKVSLDAFSREYGV
jgi:class 3 adenylate cyclase